MSLLSRQVYRAERGPGRGGPYTIDHISKVRRFSLHLPMEGRCYQLPSSLEYRRWWTWCVQWCCTGSSPVLGGVGRVQCLVGLVESSAWWGWSSPVLGGVGRVQCLVGLVESSAWWGWLSSVLGGVGRVQCLVGLVESSAWWGWLSSVLDGVSFHHPCTGVYPSPVNSWPALPPRHPVCLPLPQHESD